MNHKIIALEIFVVLVSYLVLTMPVAFATNIKIIYGGFEKNVSYNPEGLVNKVIEPDKDDETVFVSISNASSDVIETVYLYTCRGYSPTECIGHGSYESQDAGFSKEYGWSELADQTSTFPQTANIMTLVKFADPFGSKWAGFWDTVTREHSGSDFSVSTHSLDNMDLHVNYGYQNLVEDFIRDRDMIPFNPSWVQKAVFPGMTKLYELGMDSPPDITPESRSGNVITSIDKDFSFVFAESSIMNPAVFNFNPNYECGNDDCESGLGENSGNCCYDCGCLSGSYCDSSRGCQSEGGITLSLPVIPDTRVSNCNVEHHLSIAVRLDNPPTGFSITSMNYILNGTDSYTASCSGGAGTNYIYICNITVPPAVLCIEGEFILTPNSITFVISYPDGPNTVSKTLTTSFPDITIGSWTCGQFGCESHLGEDSSNCCYDCNNCPGGQYCDFETGKPSTSMCRTEPDDSNLVISDVSPTHFSSSDGSEDISFIAQITNKPQGMSTPSADCSIDCTPNCTASCFVSCRSVSSSDPSIYNFTCILSFVISNYNVLRDYTLYPILNYTMTFNNGTGPQITKTLSAGVGGITIGIHYCGDLDCTQDENQSICCYDCGCSAGQYCDTLGTTDHRLDSCKPLNLINITKVDVGSTNLTDSSIEHRVNVTLRVDSKPSGASLSAVCGFNNSVSDVACSAECGEINESGAVCQVIIPAINYSETGFYDPVARMITLPQNVMGVNLGFNDGPNVSSMDFSFSVPDITIDVIAHCGDGDCESDIGETSDNCCLDCPCGPDLYCYTGSVPTGECLSVNDVILLIDKTEPEDLNCTITEHKGKCQFLKSVDILARILNPPSDIEVFNSHYEFDGNDYRNINCFASPPDQNENYTCPTVLPEIDSNSGGGIEKNLSLYLTVRYTSNQSLITQNISASTTLTINRIKSDRVMECERVKAELASTKAKISRDKTMLYVFLGLATTVAVIICATARHCCMEGVECTWSCAFWIFLCGLAVAVVGCIGSMLHSAVLELEQEITQLEQEEDLLCSSSDPSQMRQALGNMKETGMDMVNIALGVVCAVGIALMLWGVVGMIKAPTPAPPPVQGGTLASTKIVYTTQGAVVIPQGSAYAVSGNTMAIVAPSGEVMTITSSGVVTGTWPAGTALATPSTAATFLPPPTLPPGAV